MLRCAPDRILSASQGDDNKIHNEEFMCATETPDVVIVGSSLGWRLGPLPKGWVNLSQVGGSALTGLELVYRRPNRPRVVLLESNVFGYPSRGLKKDMIDEVTFPGVRDWRCNHRILQHKYRPVDLLLSVTAGLRRAAQGRPQDDPVAAPTGSGSSAAANAFTDPPETEEQRKDRLDGVHLQLEAQSKPPPPDVLDEQVGLAVARCRALAREGTHCLLFELPMEAVVSAAPFETTVRAKFKDAMPETEFPRLPWIDPDSVLTRDGAHLSPGSARRVTAELVRWVASRR